MDDTEKLLADSLDDQIARLADRLRSCAERLDQIRIRLHTHGIGGRGVTSYANVAAEVLSELRGVAGNLMTDSLVMNAYNADLYRLSSKHATAEPDPVRDMAVRMRYETATEG